MRITNPFQINDWVFRNFLEVILALQLAMWGTIGLDAIGLQIPILRQFIGFFYLTFVPGIIILRILKLHKLGNIETLLYTVGLSIATLMFTGLFMNTVYPFFGISGPISLIPLIITISILVLILCVLSYMRDKDFSSPSFIDVKDVLSPPVLFLCLIPFLALFGTYLVNFYHTNIILMFLIVIIALIAVLIGFDKFIPKNLYPLAVFIIAISLLFHRSLLSMYLVGWDIHTETYLANLVTIDAQWDSTIPRPVNAMLSIVMLAPIFSEICSMSFTWVFKIIYPLLFSLAPLGLYRVFQKQTNDEIAFLSCFFFMSVNTFFVEMLGLARQEIAELFLVLLVLSMIGKNLNKIERAFLFIVFGVSLTVSHYGLSYIYMFFLIAAWLIVVLAKNPEMQRLRDNLHSKCSRYKYEKLAGNQISSKIKDRTISSTFVLLFITFTLTWYLHVSSSSTFDTVVNIGNHIASSLFTDFLNPEAAEGLDIMLTKTHTPLHHINKIINYLNQIFIVIGGIVLLLKHREMKFEREYAVFSMINLAILFAVVSVPFFAKAFSTARLYHISLFFLAPFCVIGGITVLKTLSKIVRVSWTNKSVRSSLKVLSVYFVIFFLFNTGFVYEVGEGCCVSIPRDKESIEECYEDARVKSKFYTSAFLEQDIVSVKWLSKNRDVGTRIYADLTRRILIFVSYGMMPDAHVLSNTTKVRDSSYLYLGYPNVHYGWMDGPVFGESWNITDISPLLDETSMIYTNGDAEVYYR